MESTEQLTRALLRDLGSAKEAIRYIDTKLTAEGRAYYVQARLVLLDLQAKGLA